jgi:medium-chain acyl-[acyl-carrier-protein] hydrolase
MTQRPTLIFRRQHNAQIDLYCLPHAGGTAASYANWQPALGEHIQVCALQMPGRAERLLDPPFETMSEMAAATAETIARHASRPFAIFGHSMGGLVAFETTRMLQTISIFPMKIFISATTPPDCEKRSELLHTLDDNALVEKLLEYGGTPEVVAAHRELMSLALPGVRADFKLIHDYVPRTGIRLSAPIAVLAAQDDTTLEQSSLNGWARFTSGITTLESFDGGHFYLHQEPQRSKVLVRIRDHLITLGDHRVSRARY